MVAGFLFDLFNGAFKEWSQGGLVVATVGKAWEESTEGLFLDGVFRCECVDSFCHVDDQTG
jgi:hypothetical protein